MIITLKGATFTHKLNLNVWLVNSSLVGVTSSNTASSVTKGDPYTTTFTIQQGFKIDANSTVSVVCNGQTYPLSWSSNEAGGTATLTIDEVTAPITITVKASTVSGTVVNPDTGDDTYTFTITPTPSTATVTLTASGYTQSGNSITVPNGTTVSWSVSASGYTTKTGTWTANGSNKTENIVLVASGGGSTITTTYTNAGYILASNGSLTGATSTWVHSDFIPISSLADNNDGICVGTFVGHGTVAAIAFYTEKDNYNSFTEGYILSSTSANKTTQSVAEVKANITNNSAQYVVFSTDGSKATLSVTTSEGSTITPEPEEPENPSTGTSGVNYYDEAGFISISTGQVTNPTSTWIHSDFIAIDSLVDDAELGHCIGKLTGHASVADIAFYSAPNFNSFIVGKSSAGATKTVATLQALMTELNATNATHIVISTDKTKNQLYASLK